MIPVSTIAAAPGWPLTLARMTFEMNDAGELVHSIDARVAAVVPPEGWDDYAAAWPQCAELIASARAAQAPTSSAPSGASPGASSDG